MKPIRVMAGVGFCVAILSAGGLVSAQGEGKTVSAGVIPQEILDEEEAYAAWQDEIGAQLAAAGQPVRGESPEERRDRLAAWFASQAQTVAEQERWSDAIDRMYAARNLSPLSAAPEPGAPQLLSGRGAVPDASRTDGGTDAGVDGALVDGSNPEALRSAIAGWCEREMERANPRPPTAGSGAARRAPVRPAGARSASLMPPPPPAALPEEQELYRIEQRKAEVLHSNPPPEPDGVGTLPDAAACECWRNEMAARLEGLSATAAALRLAIAEVSESGTEPGNEAAVYEYAE